jgi:2,4-didehydro-3-deoxy-L-rhamnonate hydrolase
MRIGNIGGTPAMLDGDGWVDLRAASQGRFADALSLYDSWDEFRAWARTLDALPRRPFDPTELGPPVPLPRQVFGAGLNYHSHLAEAGRPVPQLPQFFTKFPTCLCGPNDDIVVRTDMVDYEVELVVVLARPADNVPAAEAWHHVAGLMVGQDISARNVQRAGQLSLGKSFRTFGPTGPWVSTLDEVTEPLDLRLSCRLNGEVMQDARTTDMVFDVAQVIAALSAVTPLLPGDLIFTGTAAGVGTFRQPPVYLRPGDLLESVIEPLGALRNRCVDAAEQTDAQRVWRNLAPQP